MIKDLDEYQKQAMATLNPFKNKREQLYYAILALCGEVGELANVFKKIAYYKDTSLNGADIIDELSDVLWYVGCVADSLDIKLSEVANFSIDKLNTKRQNKGGGVIYGICDF
ncbi:nucleoside triphosphate pyrophosphohydrolase family protein [candidate division WOR-3 bacterium]|nr:nucleoside triphosphate pyrophosphohydrolase family protein [candidate division WOR-3 bacterium]